LSLFVSSLFCILLYSYKNKNVWQKLKDRDQRTDQVQLENHLERGEGIIDLELQRSELEHLVNSEMLLFTFALILSIYSIGLRKLKKSTEPYLDV